MGRESKINFDEFFHLCADEVKKLNSASDRFRQYLDHGLGIEGEPSHKIDIINIYQWLIDNNEVVRKQVGDAADSESKAVRFAKEVTQLSITLYLLTETDRNIVLVFDKNSKFFENDLKRVTKEKIIAVGATSKIKKSVGFKRGNLEPWVTSVPNRKIYQIETYPRIDERRLAESIFPNPFLLPTYYSQNYRFKSATDDTYDYQDKISTLSPFAKTNLFQFLRTPYPPSFSLGNLLWIFFSLISGTAGLHRSGIFHHDLTPSNILIDQNSDEKKSEPWSLYIGDFGSLTDDNDDEYSGTHSYTPFDHPLIAEKFNKIMTIPRDGEEAKILELINKKDSDTYSSATFTFGKFSSLNDERITKIASLRWLLKYFSNNPKITYIETSQKASKEYDTWAISAIITEMIENWNPEEKCSGKKYPEILKVILNLVGSRLITLEKHRGDCAKLLDHFLIELNAMMGDVKTPLELKEDVSKIFEAQSKKFKVKKPLNIFLDKLEIYRTTINNEFSDEKEFLNLKFFNLFKHDFKTKNVKINTIDKILKICMGTKGINLDAYEAKACFDGRLCDIILSCWKIIENGYPALSDQLKDEKERYDQREKFLYRESFNSINAESHIIRLMP